MSIAFQTDFINHLSDGVLVLNAQRQIIAANPAMENLLELTAGEMFGKSCVQVIGCPALKPFSNAICHTICPLKSLTSNFSEEDLTFFTLNGIRREVKASFSQLDAAHFMLIFKEIGWQQRQERLQAEFIATASHQLRTPLASIKTSIGLLLSNLPPDFPPLLHRLHENIQVSSLRLERVVNDLIELTNLLSKRVQLVPRRLEVSQLVEQASQLSREWLASRNQTLKVDLPENPLYVEADGGRISQVLGHLLSNASKFSPEGSIIQLTVRPQQSSQKPEVAQITFSVTDQGVGIATEEKEFIFEKFYQAQIAENTTVLGSGLGLPLAKALVELSGGRIWFQSELNKGSTFSFSLPAAYQKEPAVV